MKRRMAKQREHENRKRQEQLEAKRKKKASSKGKKKANEKDEVEDANYVVDWEANKKELESLKTIKRNESEYVESLKVSGQVSE